MCLENKSQVLEIYHVSLCTSSCVPNTDTTSLFYSHFLALERSLPFSSLCLFIYYFLFIVLRSLSKILLLLNSSSKGSSSGSLGGPFSAHICMGLRLLHHQYPLALVMNICVLMSPSRVEINSLFPMPDTVSGTKCTRGIHEIDQPQPSCPSIITFILIAFASIQHNSNNRMQTCKSMLLHGPHGFFLHHRSK